MENGTHQTNGKSTLLSTSLIEHMPPTCESRPVQVHAGPRYSRLLDLVRDAVDLELRLKATMAELEQEMRQAGHSELPSVLLSLLKPGQPNTQPQPVVTVSPVKAPSKPGPTKAKPRTTAPAKNRGGKLKAQVMGLMADGKERKSIDIVHQLKAKNPTSIYSVLSELATEGHLIRTKFAHYRLKMRKA